MARCIFCDEWAGRDSDQHESCRLEFDRQMRQPGLTRRAFSALLHAARTMIALLAGAMARTR